MTTKAAPARSTLNLRIRPDLRHLIDQGAEARGQNRTDFILEAARRAAEEALLDRTLLTTNPARFKAFLARLDSPARPNPALAKTMRSPAPWD